ncbi:MAG: HipA domain-containing protein [Rikenellaceae bacterium]
MREIKNCPSTLSAGHSTYSSAAIRRLFGGKRVSHVMNIGNLSEDDNRDIQESVTRISLSGVQQKYSAVIEKGEIILTPQGRQGEYILKPTPNDKGILFRHSIPANEHLTMQIARQVFKIETAENGLLFDNDGNPIYITKRFDIAADGSKINQEDFASLRGKTKSLNGSDFKYQGSYEDIADEIHKRVAAYPVELSKFFDLLIFNYIFGNNDAHLKNFSLMQTTDGDYRLTPAYDLLNATLHVENADFALDEGLSNSMERSDIYYKTGHPTSADFAMFGNLIGLPSKQVAKIINKYNNPDSSAKVEQLINDSFLDDKLQRMYKRSYEERMRRFTRE